MKRPEGFDSKTPQSSQKATSSNMPGSKSRGVDETKVRSARASSSVKERARDKVITISKKRTAQPKLDELQEPQVRVSRGRLRVAARERRRFERREVHRFTRRSRNRRLGWSLAVGTVAVLITMLSVAIYSPLLALRTIEIDGVSTVDPAAVREAIDGQLGTPLALLDLGKLRSELDHFPLIRSFATEVIPPSTLKVHIVERSPVGVITTPAGFSVVDPAGVVLESPSTRPAGIPLIELAGAGTDSVAFTAVVNVILALPESIRSQVDVAQATSKDDVRLILLGAGQRVLWGSPERSALKARVLMDLMATQGPTARVEFDVSAPLSPVVRPG